MKLNGIKDLIPFLDYLRTNKVHFFLEHHRFDSVMVTYTLVGKRVEVDFFDDHIEYSEFDGNEDVFDDQAKLFADISKHV